jgi:histidine triad (HIT) family protein
MSEDCIFCKINKGEITAKIIYQDETVIAFNDLNPQAPQHVLIIPRKHIATINDIKENQETLSGHMITVAAKIAAEKNLAADGYRLVFNCNSKGGQEVYHIHLHLLAGRQMQWPPG